MLALPGADPLSLDTVDERSQLEEILSAATLYDCTPLIPTIAKMWEGRSFRFTSDCFGPLPPFPVTGIEDKIDKHNRSLTLFQSSKVTDTPTVASYFLRENALQRTGIKDGHIRRIPINEAGPKAALTTAEWMVSVSVLVPMGQRDFVFIDNFLAYFCDKQGKLLTSPLMHPQLTLRLSIAPNDATTEIIEEVIKIGQRQFNRATSYLNLMALRNVSSSPRTVDRQLQKARQRRGAPPLAEYYVLTVTLPGKAKRGEPNGTITPSASEPMPLQLIPGQYRDYRENGLFGKYKGIFWVPAHTRGDAEVGAVKKDYRAVPGAINEKEVNDEASRRSELE